MGQKSPTELYARSVLVTLLGLSLHMLLGPSMNLVSFMLAFPTIYLVTSFWGFGPALLSILMWTLAISYFDFEPRYSFHVTDPREVVHLVTFLLTTIPVSWIVDRKEREELRLRQDTDRLEQENQIRDQFVNTISHDLRTPLTIARMSSEMILRNNKEEVNKKHLARLIASLSRIDSMISNLLDGRRLTVGNPLQLNQKIFNLEGMFKKILESFEALNTHRLTLTHTENELLVNWSEDHIQRCLENLIMNALKYGDAQTPIEFGFSKKEDDRVHFWVKNKGPVIQPDKLQTLFEPFTRGETAKGKQGWGIGLNLIREIVKAHKGAVSATSSEAEGTIFSVVMPANP